MSELDIINQKAGPLGETVKKDFSDFAGGNPFAKSVKNASSMGLDDDITGQSLQGKIPNPLSSSEVGPSRLEYPIDVSGNPAYAATIKFQVMEYTVASPGTSQKNHVTPTTDNIQSQETAKAKVEDDPGLDAFGGLGNDVINDGTSFSADTNLSGYGGLSAATRSDFSDFSGSNTFKAKEDAVKEFNEVKKQASTSGGARLGFFPKPNSPIVTMYFPPSQAFVDGVSYGDASLGTFAGAGLAGAEAGLSGIGVAMQQLEDAKDAAVETFLTGGVNVSDVAKNEAARFTVAKALNLPVLRTLTSTDKAFGQAVTLANRVIVNPNVRKLFNGVIVRECAFQFKMIPTSPEEGEAIKKIVKFFRKELYPRAFRVPIGGVAEASLGFNFPNAFKIKFNFKNSENLNVPKLLECYLRNVSHTINPTGGGFKNDGKPNEVDLTLTFVEHRAIEQQDIEKGF